LPDDRRDYFFDLVSNQKNVFLWANGHEVLPLEDNLSDRRPYTSTFFSKTVQVNNMAMDMNGTIYVGTLSDGLFAFAKDEWGDYSNLARRISTCEDELPSNVIQCLYQDSKDVIWVGTPEGIASITNGEVKNLSKRELFPQTWWQKFLGRERERPVFSESVHAITSWGDSMLFAGDDDLYKASVLKDSLQYLSKYDLPNRLANPLSDIKELLVDIDGNVWIAGNQLIHFNITRDQLSVMSDLHHFRGQGFLSIAEDVATEKIWIGTNRGGLYKMDYPDPNKGIGY
jgi:ligand-binding sensor domain-containing protein